MITPNTEAKVLASLMDRSHRNVLSHLDLLSGHDPHHRSSVGGKELNSAFWIVAHLAVSENWLVLRGSRGSFRKFSWAKHFSIGSTPPPVSECPPWNEVLDTYRTVHADAIAHVAGLDQAALDAPHEALMRISAGNDVRAILGHHLLHESGHCGQLAWLCAIHGVPLP